MTDKQKSIISLTFVSETCTAALSAVTGPTGTCDTPDADLAVILKDLDGILAILYNLTTKLSLALKPSSPTYSASITLLQDLAKHTSALVHCTGLVRETFHGATLNKQVKNQVKGIIEALRALVQTFLNNAARGPQMASSGASGEEYLVRTGTLHELITNARGPSGIKKNNQEAVYQMWKSDRESLEDNLHEIDRVIKEAERGDGEDQAEDEFDDGWDDLGLGSSSKLDNDELARAKNVQFSVHQILRLTTLLHKRIFLDLLASPASAPASTFDTLLMQSNFLLTTSDDLVAALYPPQDPSSVRQEITALANVAAALQSQCVIFFPAADELTNQLDALTIEETSTPTSSQKETKKRADKEWFGACFDKVTKLCISLSESLDQTRKPSGGE